MGTHYSGSDDEKRTLDTYIKLMRAANSLSSKLGEEFHRYGLTESQFGVLEALFHLGPLCLSDLGRKILRSEANMTLVVDNLEKNNYVIRKRSKKDRRFIVVHLTETGKAKMASVMEDHVGILMSLFSVLSPQEQSRLSSLCKKLGVAAAGDRYSSPKGCRGLSPEESVCFEPDED